MEQLPTKEQILEKHYEAITVKYPNKNWLLSVYDAPESVEMMLGAMEEYAAVRVAPLVEELKQLRQWKKEAMEVYAPIHEYAQYHPQAKLGTSMVAFVVERARKYDETITGEQPKVSVGKTDWFPNTTHPENEIRVFLWFPSNGNMNIGYYSEDDQCWHWQEYGEYVQQSDYRKDRVFYWTYHPGEQPAQQSFSFTYEELKKFTTDFYFWWHNNKGTNTYSGFDDFMNQQSIRTGEQPNLPIAQQVAIEHMKLGKSAGVWIDNSLRKPVKDGFYFVKYLVSGGKELFKNGKWQQGYAGKEIIEWLYESEEQPAQQPEPSKDDLVQWATHEGVEYKKKNRGIPGINDTSAFVYADGYVKGYETAQARLTGNRPVFTFNYEDLKKFATDFYYWWHNSKGTNTLQGFDEFMKMKYSEAGEQPLKSEG